MKHVSMKRKQIVDFWQAVHNSVNISSTIKSLFNKHGYGGKRTLERLVQVDSGFKKGLSIKEITEKTGWASKRIAQYKVWWEAALPDLIHIKTADNIINPKSPIETCLAPPEKVDVSIFRSCGVPKKEAPDILLKWRECHRQGKHQKCKLFSDFEEDLRIRKIPYQQAKNILEIALWGI